MQNICKNSHDNCNGQLKDRVKNRAKSKWKFSDIISDPKINDRWEKVRKYFFLRESTYDMTNRCNIKCEGCYYYEGEKQFAKENNNIDAWQTLMESEKKRGITYAVLAGAEPSLVSDLCLVCFQNISLGCIATNGLKFIPDSIDYKIHISVWGNDKTSEKTRNAKHLLQKQNDNYKNDKRAVFVYTFTRDNIEETFEVVDYIAKNNGKVTFNIFSAPNGYNGYLSHNSNTLLKTRQTMVKLLKEYPENVLFSTSNIMSHTHDLSLHNLYSCPYPRMNPKKDIGLGRSFRQYKADLTWDRNVSCCVPDTNCDDCRHYAAGSAIVTSKLFRHASTPDTFRAWLDYVDTYLAVWVMGYKKSSNLCSKFIEPPKHK